MRIGFAAVLVVSALLKLASPGSSAAALGTFGVRSPRLRRILLALLIAAEVGLAAGVAAGVDAAAWAAAALMAAFALALLAALRSGRGGAPCACFGARSKVGWPGVVRNLALAIGFAALPLLPAEHLSTDQWLGLGLAVALLACTTLAVAVLALAREVGMLRLRLGPSAALEVEHEGPPLGSRAPLIEHMGVDPRAEMALAVFTSPGCHLCKSLEPAVASLAQEPFLSARTFDEQGDRDVWRELNVPASPYAVALDIDGTVLAKGIFNSLAQLESVLATAEHRREAAKAEGRTAVSA